MSRRFSRASLLALAFVSPFAAADEPAEEVVITATRSAQRVSQTIQSTSVITEREIRASQAIDLPTLLRKEAGIEYSQSGGLGRVGSLFVRGANPNQTLILIDGVRVNSATSGAMQLDQLMLDQVERIEIVRGGGSALYGSDAMGGVVQIFTKQGRGAPAPNFSVGFGNENTQRYVAGYSGEVGDTRFNVNLSRVSTNGFSSLRESASPTADPDLDSYSNNSGSLSLSHYFNERFKVGASYFETRGKSQFDDAFAGSRLDKQTGESQVSAGTLFAEGNLTDWWQSRLTYARGTDRFDNFLNSTQVGRFDTLNNTYTWQNDFTVAANQNVILGAEALQQEVSSSVDYTQTSRNVNSVFGGYRATFGPVAVQANLRNDHYSDFGSKNSYLAGLGWQFAQAWRATVSQSQSFRAPSFNELYFPLFGNPSLQPEQSNSTEVGLQWAAGPHLARVAAYYTRYKDLITNFPLVNVGEATVKGVELSYAGRIEEVDLRATLTFLDAKNDDTGERLIRRATHFGSFTAARDFGRFRVGGELVASGNRYDNDVFSFQRVLLPGYAVVNLVARYAITKTMAIGLRVDNLFDTDYTLISGYNTQGRLVLATFTYTPER
jgi:vitamin B12 transporter